MDSRSSYLLLRVKAPDKALEGSGPPKRASSNVRKLLRLLWKEWPTLCTGIVGLSVSSLTNLLFPKVLGAALDVACGRPPPRNLSQKAFLLSVLSIFLTGASASFVRVYCLGSVAETTTKRLRDRLYAALLRQDILFFSTTERTDLVHRLTKECQVAADSAVAILAEGYRSLNSSIGASFMLFRLSPKLTLFALATLPCLGISAMSFKLFMNRLNKKYEAELARLRASTDEKLGAVSAIKLFTQENYELELFKDETALVASTARKYHAAEGFFMGGLSLSINASLSSVLWIGGSIVAKGDLTTGGLTSFLLYSGFMCLGFSQLSTLASRVRSTNESTAALFELIDDDEIVGKDDKVLAKPSLVGPITFEQVSFQYPTRPEVPVIQNCTWSIPQGAMVALVGASGAGKSTISSLVTKLLTPSSGCIKVNGVALSDIDTTYLRQHIGSVRQEPSLFSTSIMDNIRYGNPAATDEEVHNAAIAAHAHDFIMEMPNGYDTLVSSTTISGGQKQRIALARALVKKPQILILDEATSALDGHSEHGIQETLRQLEEITVIVIAHRLSTIQSCDTIGVLENRQIVETGTYAELNASGTAFYSLVAAHAFEESE
ncbi:ATP-binding Cassette (ABC) Superfamily [Thraustotheca clavata]|uniref:Mitochondrial potassium channel ATP-binding subunit n=1 Tax=Thraustotheca clavata TaxID=74557 RepID=A0A1V9ZHI9_9STRA|nr:ATP-binding Cassette (ABC) Superfamily [Thraustotheca clavata]